MGERQGFRKVEENPEEKQQVKKSRKCLLCFGICSVLLVSLAIVVVVLSQTVFKFRDLNVTLQNGKVENVSVNFDLKSLSTLVSMDVAVDVVVENPNYYEFRYENSTVVLVYRDSQVGEVEVGNGKIRARKVVVIPAVVVVEAVKVVAAGLQDATTGVASVVLDAVIPGRVNLANVYKKHVTAILTCDVDIFLGNRTLKLESCKHSIRM